MAKFLNTSAITYHLEELLKGARERLVIISPYLRFNDKIRELLEDKDRMKIDIRIVYGKNELHPDESNWLKSLAFVRCSFCKHLHAKCYLNESWAIVTSMNMYEFSQVNNNEMGILITREDDPELFDDTYTEAQRLIRVSDEVKITVEKVNAQTNKNPALNTSTESAEPKMVSTTQLAKLHGCASKEMFSRLLTLGYISRTDNKWQLTDTGKQIGGALAQSKRFGEYITWPNAIKLETDS